MRRYAYLLILLVFWSQADEYCAASVVRSSVPIDDVDDDEYLPSRRFTLEDETLAARRSIPLAHPPQIVDFSASFRSLLSWSGLTRPVGASSLYLCISLQI
jgi:hypothetical protein